MSITFLWITLAVLTALAASSRGRSVPRWLAIGIFFPGIGLIAVLAMRALPKTGVDALAHEDLRACPNCSEAIQAASANCKQCGEDVLPIDVKDRSGWIARFTCITDEEFDHLAAKLAEIDLPTILDESPVAIVGPFEDKGEAQNVLGYLKSNHALDGMLAWRSVTR
ncbi:hypothetical protein BLL42_02075 [Pseudomonas frederiksbergensis]|uniref:Zinc ribbon domain-containing protein n=1 Tax=Pseudomonas frederiksbergensis TaxID=104087 RepID=A0A1J0EEP6_9PSED|nr:hypothetical protein [Pseudomonas frederiksbergensis]APC14578.1 hypothetical protein BLL42_02075 [Pseudomonas frederiksbergensis]